MKSSSSTALPLSIRRGRLADIVAAYLDNWDKRRAGAQTPRVYDRPETDVWVALLNAELFGRFASPVARAVARREVLTHAATTGEEPPPVVNVAGLALLRISADAPPEAHALLQTALEKGGQEQALTSLAGMTWRLALLGAAARTYDTGRHDPEIDVLAPRIARAATARAADPEPLTPQSLSTVARLAHALAVAAREAARPELTEAARELLGDLDRLLQAAGDECSTLALAQSVVALAALENKPATDRVVDLMIETRLDERRSLLRTEAGESRFETSPWTPLSLVVASEDVSSLESVFDPPAPALPAYTVSVSAPANERLEIRLGVDGGAVTRVLEAEDFDLLLAQMLDQLTALEPGELSARLHGHVVIGLLEILERTDDPQTRSAVESRIRHGLEEILARQEGSGGWQYARKAPSVIYGAGAASMTEFPDHQYTIDAAVPGIALMLAHCRYGDDRYLTAAESAFAFVERDVGRVDWAGKPVWRLYPGDEKTAKQGTAVNYEVWLGFFLAALAAGTRQPAIAERAKAYIEELVDYTAGHLLESGDIRYGDYVRELRTPYASWDAYLLAEIDRLIGHPPAREMARRIVERLGDVQLSCGAIPNVVDYRQEVEGFQRNLVHRHGVGPYPIRGYYQLYFVGAAAVAGAAKDAAARAFAFVMMEMYRRPFGDMSTGFFADGRFDDRPDSLARIGRDWLLLALAGVGRFTDMDYRPRLSRVRPGQERLADAVRVLGDRARAELEAGGWSWSAYQSIRRAGDALAQAGCNISLGLELPDLPPDPEPLRLSSEHSARMAESIHAAACGAAQGDWREPLRTLLERQTSDGLWPMRHRPAGDERQGDVLISLLDIHAQTGDAPLGDALRSGLEGAWAQLFVHGTGAGMQRPGVRSPMNPRLVFRHALAFVLGEHQLGLDDGTARARWILRHAFLTETAVDGVIRFPADREFTVADAYAHAVEALARILALVPDFVPDAGHLALAAA